MNLRKAESKDIPKCITLSKIEEFVLPGNLYPDQEYFETSIEKGIFLVAEENNEVIGLAVGFQLTKTYGFLDLLTVAESHRSKKVGESLINTFRKEMKSKGIKSYSLISPSNNPRSVNFYRKQNLKEGEQYTLFLDDMDE
tara:strand:- start:4029 stop:4448 length:420 start_codon:yes stop_codon:yes gene_type:complete